MLWRSSPSRSRRSPPTGFIRPCQPILVDHPPAGPDWLHEVKHDGYRIIARKEEDRATLWTRHGTNFTDRLPKIAEAVRRLPVERALIDGEAVSFFFFKQKTAYEIIPDVGTRPGGSTTASIATSPGYADGGS